MRWFEGKFYHLLIVAFFFDIRAFLFPEDQQIELEYWAVTGEFSNTELSQMKVLLFCVFCLFHFARKNINIMIRQR